MNHELNFVEKYNFAKEVINQNIAKAKDKFNETHLDEDKQEYERFLEEMKKLNDMDEEIINKYAEPNIKKYDFNLGIYDNVTKEVVDRIEKEVKKADIYGIGVYSDNIVETKYLTAVEHSTKERMESAKKIPGVSFVFEVDTNDTEEIKDLVRNEFEKYLNNNN